MHQKDRGLGPKRLAATAPSVPQLDRWAGKQASYNLRSCLRTAGNMKNFMKTFGNLNAASTLYVQIRRLTTRTTFTLAVRTNDVRIPAVLDRKHLHDITTPGTIKYV